MQDSTRKPSKPMELCRGPENREHRIQQESFMESRLKVKRLIMLWILSSVIECDGHSDQQKALRELEETRRHVGLGTGHFGRDEMQMEWLVLSLCCPKLLLYHVALDSFQPHFLRPSMVFAKASWNVGYDSDGTRTLRSLSHSGSISLSRSAISIRLGIVSLNS